MRHDWIFDMLEDLRVYAALNGLPATVLRVEEALRIARAEAAIVHDTPHRTTPEKLPLSKRPN